MQNVGRDIIRFEVGCLQLLFRFVQLDGGKCMWPEHVIADTLYNIRCVDGLFVVLSESTTE